MFKSIHYVLSENIKNIYRIFAISKYELVSEIRDSKLGIFWNFANPIIQILTYWFVFGVILERGNIDGIPYISWMLGGMIVWFFISPCITNGCKAIHSKVSIITKMKFPVSILPTTVTLKEFINHLILLFVVMILLTVQGYGPSVSWFGLLYYAFCAVVLGTSLAMTLSVLNMLARDTRKLVLASMRLLLYMTPILWTIPPSLPNSVKFILEINPIYYIVQGYRDCFFYSGEFITNISAGLTFWVITVVLFVIGSMMMYRFRYKFIDMI